MSETKPLLRIRPVLEISLPPKKRRKPARRDFINGGLRQSGLQSRVRRTPKSQAWDVVYSIEDDMEKVNKAIYQLNMEYRISVLGESIVSNVIDASDGDEDGGG
jgi:hypothetical protein